MIKIACALLDEGCTPQNAQRNVLELSQGSNHNGFNMFYTPKSESDNGYEQMKLTHLETGVSGMVQTRYTGDLLNKIFTLFNMCENDSTF